MVERVLLLFFFFIIIIIFVLFFFFAKNEEEKNRFVDWLIELVIYRKKKSEFFFFVSFFSHFLSTSPTVLISRSSFMFCCTLSGSQVDLYFWNRMPGYTLQVQEKLKSRLPVKIYV